MTKKKLSRRKFIESVTGITSSIILLPSFKSVKKEKQPNVILFLADDLGYGDLLCYNQEGLQTPAIESISKQGVRFTSYYSCGPECSPTRTALLTGRYQHRVGGMECAIGSGNVGRYDDAIRLRETNNLGLPVSETSIARMLKAAGYNTAICGKWHLGYEDKFNPNLHGFDYAFYGLGGDMDYFHHMEKPPISLHVLYQNGEPVNKNGYITDLIGEESLNFLDSQTERKPFFLYVPFTAPHAPFQGPEDYLPEILPENSPLWDQSRGPKHTYQAMIKRMDETIGNILKRVEEKGISDNTLVIFMSDNGGTTSGNNSPLNGFKGNLFEGGIRVPCVAKWPGKIAAGTLSSQACMTFDFSASIVRAAGAPLPEKRPFDGIDILKLLEEKRTVEERTLFWRARRGNITRKAVRKGSLKYICLNSEGKVEEYLFNIDSDPSERTNLFNSHSGDVNKLKTLLNAWEEEVKPVR
jgi:arylsulfatase A-like enzyme